MNLPEVVHYTVIHEDELMMVINKAIGTLVHPVSPSHPLEGTLVGELQKKGTPLSTLGGAQRPGLVHRLDRYTEGLMVIAKTNDAHEKLSEQFKNRLVKKKYYAMVYGDIKSDSLTINKPIGRHHSKRMKMSTDTGFSDHQKEAITHITVLKRYNTKTLLDVEIETGRTHQIRVHLASIDHPVIGDPLYQKKHKKKDGQLLQAYYLAFDHPSTGKSVNFELPISKRF